MTKTQKTALAALEIAGAQMANLCFNLSQQPQNPHSKSMREMYKAWDTRLSEFKASMQKKERTK